MLHGERESLCLQASWSLSQTWQPKQARQTGRSRRRRQPIEVSGEELRKLEEVLARSKDVDQVIAEFRKFKEDTTEADSRKLKRAATTIMWRMAKLNLCANWMRALF
jgi:hypothetical protein